MAERPTTCANCNHPIAETQPKISAKNSIRTQDFFHADASGCSEASSARHTVRSHRNNRGQGKVGIKMAGNSGKRSE
jgi:hypothetical protein